jgi:hypothetical protein
MVHLQSSIMERFQLVIITKKKAHVSIMRLGNVGVQLPAYRW